MFSSFLREFLFLLSPFGEYGLLGCPPGCPGFGILRSAKSRTLPPLLPWTGASEVRGLLAGPGRRCQAVVAGPRRPDERGVGEGVRGEVVLVVGSCRLHALVAGWQLLPGLQGRLEFTLFGELRLFVFRYIALRAVAGRQRGVRFHTCQFVMLCSLIHP